MTAMTLEQVRDRLRDVDGGPVIWTKEGRDLADAIDAHLAQPAQAVDVGALDELRNLWPRWRQLVDGFVDSEHWNTGWDAETRQSMIDWGLKWLADAPEVSRG